MQGKRGLSGSNSGIVVIILTVLIVLYILFLPPADREALLQGTGTPGSINPGTSGGAGSAALRGQLVLKENVGDIEYQSKDEKTYDMPTFTISTDTQSKAIKQKSASYIKTSAFQEMKDSMTFDIDPELYKNLILSFNVQESEGRLTIRLNNQIVYSGELSPGSSPPIYLDQYNLENTNILEFSVSGPGIAFWRYNYYSLNDLKIFAEVKDVSSSDATQVIDISQAEHNKIDKATLRYLPVCKEANLRNFRVLVNNQVLFRGIPDCNVQNYVIVPKNNLYTGNNQFSFSIDQGSVMIDRLMLDTDLKEPEYPVYYFELDEDLFINKEKDEVCGDADGYCPRGCEEDEDVDCCFDRSVNYWCDVETSNLNNRCVSFINDCDLCPSGYEDDSGEPPEKCVESINDKEPYCGDDTDGECPAGCSMYYDKDCCYENEDYYWCEDVPRSGISSVCEEEVSEAECDDCPYGYENEDGESPDCRGATIQEEEDEQLDPDYSIKMRFTFPNTEGKRLEIFINGRKIGVNTALEKYERNIDEYVKSGTNSIEIRPLEDVTITELRVFTQ